MKKIQEISIVGLGLVGQTLTTHFLSKGLKIKQIVSRKPVENPDASIEYIKQLNQLKPVDLVLICVNDQALVDVVAQIPENQLIAYTSGAVELKNFQTTEHVAVCYPLQSFAHLNPAAVKDIPILIEAQSSAVEDLLKDFAFRYFDTCQVMDSEKRAQLHIAAVFANNFTNHLIDLAQKHCEANNLSFELLLPLIKESAQKWKSIPASELQTGPAKRGDWNVIEQHKSHLSEELKVVYEVLTQSILSHYKREL